MKKLHIIIIKEYFDEIKTGKKKFEYRAMSPYWTRMLLGRHYDTIVFRNGYKKGAPTMEVEYKGVYQTRITHKHFGEKPVRVFAIQLGAIIHPAK